MIRCKVWSEKLAVYLYDITVIDLKDVSLYQLSGLLKSAGTKLSPNKLSEILSCRKSDFLEVLTSTQPLPWMDKLSSAIYSIDFSKFKIVLCIAMRFSDIFYFTHTG